MTGHTEENSRMNQLTKQPKEKKETLTDYLEKKLTEAGIKSERKKLPKDKVRVFFKR
ncbi:MAG: hypothetical protein JSV31_25340 [Desulfobacterales bacterium]|nr:MAG: hypothetical protein JSV31_25340 [Desulfobacterales bacterium]